jgi:murein DD-endopeptidase MepM/ murein hydrolase activator NlpD
MSQKNGIVSIALCSLALLISVREHRSFYALREYTPCFIPQEEQADGREDGSISANVNVSEIAIDAQITCEKVPDGSTVSKVVEVGCGDTLFGILHAVGVDSREIDAISKKLATVHNLRSLQIGQPITIEWINWEKPILQSIELSDKIGNKITVKRNKDKFSIVMKRRELRTVLKCVRAVVKTTLPDAASFEGVPQAIITEMSNTIRSAAHISKLRRGDYFEAIYEENRDAESDRVVGRRTLKYVSVKTGAKVYRLYNFGNGKYYNEKGESTKTEMLISPFKNRSMRISSNFGYRRHPVLGTVKYHTGVDYAAQYGTEIYSAANGVVVKAGRHGSYGLYLRIRHANGFETAYAHLSAISVRVGARVRQGDPIGRVGRSGRVTGAHLHHEVILCSNYVDPQKYYKIGAVKLTGRDLADFNNMKAEVAARLLSFTRNQQQA